MDNIYNDELSGGSNKGNIDNKIGGKAFKIMIQTTTKIMTTVE